MKKMMIVLVAFALVSAIAVSAQAGSSTKGKEVTYKSGHTVMKGYLAYDENIKGKRPGILVVHEWWGHNEYTRKRARMLAEMGYAALAVDMYGEGKQAAHPDDAGKFVSEVMKISTRQRQGSQPPWTFLKRSLWSTQEKSLP